MQLADDDLDLDGVERERKKHFVFVSNVTSWWRKIKLSFFLISHRIDAIRSSIKEQKHFEVFLCDSTVPYLEFQRNRVGGCGVLQKCKFSNFREFRIVNWLDGETASTWDSSVVTTTRAGLCCGSLFVKHLSIF